MINNKYRLSAATFLFAGLSIVAVAGMAYTCTDLHLGVATDKLFVFTCLVMFSFLGAVLVWREYRRLDYAVFALLLTSAAMLLRVALFDYKSGDYLACLQYWYEDIERRGGFSAIAYKVGNYNVPYLYFIAAISYLDVPNLYLYKLFSVLWDVILAWGCLRLVRVVAGDEKPLASLTAFSIALLLPTAYMNSALWAQCDAIYAALCVHAVSKALQKENKVSVALVAVAFSFKLQTVFLLPFWGVLWVSGRVKFQELFVFPATYLLTILPAVLLGKPVKDIVGVYFGQLGEYPQLTLKAPNAYQFIPYGFQCDEKLVGRIGIAAAVVLVVVLLGLAYKCKDKLDNEMLLKMAVLLCVGVPFFLPHMHERYFFLADIFTLCLACTNFRFAPIAILTEFSSRACYFAYFTGKRNYLLQLGNLYFPMGVETLAMLTALTLTSVTLVVQLKKGMNNSGKFRFSLRRRH